ncbi:N-acetylglucosamine-6-phosphate deacetylase [Brevibacillus daliensis]|uniref:N-acetylglucosamine-6-phosphate deacetylase n=1 Tax=Brevibacillus daliensis TaxID=2892995 RepID=UPI001E434EE2|nr:N-acetylglucosamine-6-phosphate deacetylase [Brevibacillus daliensis]
MKTASKPSHYNIKASSFVLDNGVFDTGYLEIRDGRFGEYSPSVPLSGEIVDLGESIIAPGLVDIHIHGFAGHDVMDNNIEALQNISKFLPMCGVTSFLPTTLTSSTEELTLSLATVAKTMRQGVYGAKIAGAFLEGPFFTEKYKGAQNPAYFKNPSSEDLHDWLMASEGQLIRIALAPEREGTMTFIRYAKENGVEVCLGHTDASFACCNEAIQNGANSFVHTFNGMKGLHHREPGVVGAVLVNDDAYAELIADGHHVHPAAIEALIRCKGKEKVVLISDCMRAGGLEDGTYLLGEFPVRVKDGVATTESGSLAGSTLKLLDGVKNIMNWTDTSLLDAFHMASKNPAACIGKEDRIGSIREGKDADFLVLDQQFELKMTFINGEIKYKR